MKEKTTISLTELNQKIETFKTDISNFSQENESEFEQQLNDIKLDTQFVLLESEERQKERIENRSETNKKILEYNKQGPKKAIEEYIKENTHEFLATLQKKGMHMDDHGDILIGKIKKGNKISNVVPIHFNPKQMITKDHYEFVRARLHAKESEIVLLLTQIFDNAKEKAKNIFESYTNPEQLFDKLGIAIQKVNYSFFTQEQKKEKLPRKGGIHDGLKDKPDYEPPTFKKIGSLMKHLLDNNIPFRANNIIEDNNQRYQFYFYDKDITILISDEVTCNCFRDSTYAIKGIVPGLRNVNKEELKNYQGKRIMFNENRNRRMESVFTDDPQNWQVIGEDKEEPTIVPKTMITDRATFLQIIKEHFTPKNLTTATYRKFAKEYNERQGNKLLLNDTIYGSVSLLGLGGKRTIEDIKKAIFESKKPKLEIPKDAYFSNEHTKQKLLAIQNCESFDSEKIIGSTSYGTWVLELLRKAYKEEFVDAVKNKSLKEKKSKLEEYTGVKDMPLFASKITSMLGGRVRSVDAEYHKMLRERFTLNIHDKSTGEFYNALEDSILEYEIKWEDQGLHPNTNKADKRIKHQEEEPYQQDQTNEKIEKKEEPPKVISSKRLKGLQEKTQIDLGDTLKDPITMQTFPLYTIKSVKIVDEHALYRVAKAYNCPIELRLSKSSVGNNAVFLMGDKVNVFGVKKNVKENYIQVCAEREDGYHKVVKFRNAHPDTLVDEFIRGETYEAVVNNMSGRFAYVSLTKNYSGRLVIRIGTKYKIGDIVKVVFDGMGANHQNNPFIKLQ